MKKNDINPLTKYYHKKFPIQSQRYPGLEIQMKPAPDCGEESYIGSGRLDGMRALITGGDSGIGRAVAIAFAREGADVAITYTPPEEKDAQEVKYYIEQAGHRAYLIPGNLADENFARRVVTSAAKKLGGLDIMVLNAGYQQHNDNILTLPTPQLIDTFAINLFSMFWMTQSAVPLMKPGSCIITTTSIEAYHPDPGLLDYAASKAAIMAFTHGLAKQLAPRGIRVNGVAPGPIWTALQVSGGQKKSDIPTFGQDTPLKRAGQPVELASTYVLLASPNESSYTTAEIYGVTGGNHIM